MQKWIINLVWIAPLIIVFSVGLGVIYGAILKLFGVKPEDLSPAVSSEQPE